MQRFKQPLKQGLYDPKFEHDACGIGMIAHLKKNPSHQIVKQGIAMLCRLEHRGSQGGDHNTGDGAGILIQLPHSFFQKYLFTIEQKTTGKLWGGDGVFASRLESKKPM